MITEPTPSPYTLRDQDEQVNSPSFTDEEPIIKAVPETAQFSSEISAFQTDKT